MGKVFGVEAPFRQRPPQLRAAEGGGLDPGSQIFAPLQLMALEDVTPSLQQEAARVDADAQSSAEKLKRSRRPPLNYLDLGIPAGSTLVYQDGQTTCTVLDGSHVSFRGESAFLSAVTAELQELQRAEPLGPVRRGCLG